MNELQHELHTAQEAIQLEDFGHAVHHLAGAIGMDPDSEALEDLLCNFSDAAGEDALSFVSIENGAYFGKVALRAWLLEDRGYVGEAISLLLLTQSGLRDVSFNSWFETWIDEPGAVSKIEPTALASGAYEFFAKAPPELLLADVPIKDEDILDTIEILLSLLQEAHELRPEDPELLLVTSTSLRKAGRFEDAEELTSKAVRKYPSFNAYVAFAGIQREKGDIAGAIASFRKALEHQPEDVAVRLDIGDLLMDVDMKQALSVYEEVLEREPEHPWALPSALFLRVVLRNDKKASTKLQRLGDENNERAQSLAGNLGPYVLTLPPRPEALLVPIQQILQDGGTLERLSVSSIEAPSAVLSIKRTLEEFGHPPPPIVFGFIPKPDPRDPIERANRAVWQYQCSGFFSKLIGKRSIEATPAVRPPDQDCANSIARIATQPYDLSKWWRKAKGLASTLRGEEGIESLLGVLVHPPERDDDFTQWDWIFRVQIAACFTIANLERRKDREALFDLVLGPVDWTSTAAVVALSQLAIKQEPFRGQVVELLMSVLSTVASSPESGPIHFTNLVEPISLCLLRIPGLPEEVYAVADELLGPPRV